MGDESNICGLAVEVECPAEVTVEKVTAFAFLVWFLDNVADLISRSINPKIEVNLLQQKENSPLQVILRPGDIDNIHLVQTLRRFSIVMDIYCAETIAVKSFGLLLATATVCTSVVNTVSKRKGFTYVPRFQIINLNQARIQFTITKSI